MNAEFFASLKDRSSGVFGTTLSQKQVDGMNALLEAGAGMSAPYVAHVLGEVYHETGGGMYPVKETVFPYSTDKNPSDATVIARLDRAYAKGQLPWVKSAYWRDGMFGRGQLQITHLDNYRKCSALTGVDQVSDPSKALELPVSAANAMRGCEAGIFTGKKLADYDRGGLFDHVSARAIVNGDKNKREEGSSLTNGQKVAAYAKAFEAALDAGGWRTGPDRNSPPLQAPPAPDTPPTPTTPPQRSLWAALASLLAGFFGKDKA